jgi:hypothetical protein
MIRAVIRNQNGKVTQGPFNFKDSDDFAQFAIHNEKELRMERKSLERIETSFQYDEAQLHDVLIGAAMSLNGWLKHFVIDQDLYQRLHDRDLDPADAQLLASVFAEAGDALKELVAKETGDGVQAQQAA